MPSHDLALGANFTSSVLLLNPKLLLLARLCCSQEPCFSWDSLLLAVGLLQGSEQRVWGWGCKLQPLRAPVALGDGVYVCSKGSAVTWCSCSLHSWIACSSRWAPKNVEALRPKFSIARSARHGCHWAIWASSVLLQVCLQAFLRWFLTVGEDNCHAVILQHVEENHTWRSCYTKLI